MPVHHGLPRPKSTRYWYSFMHVPAALCCLMLAASSARGEHLGSPDLEPGLIGRSDIVFFEDFEYADFHTQWGQSSVPTTCGRVTDPVFDGQYALRVTVPQGQHTGIAWQWKFAQMGLPEPEEVYFRYYIYLDDTWRLAAGGQVGKLPGPAGTYGVAGWGGRPSHGDDGWSARMSNYDRGDYVEMSYYCYHADMTGIYGNNWTWGTDAYLARGRWYCIETYAMMNSITDGVGNNDGILRGWVDGELVFEKSDIRFRDVYSLKIECIWFNVYVGGSWAADWDMDAYFDNMVFAYNYVGPMAAPALVASDPPADGTLAKTQNNIILLTFDDAIALPAGPALSIFGGGWEEGNAFTYSVEPDGATLKAAEEGPMLTDQTWYRVTPAEDFAVEPFVLDLCTLAGDANNSGRVTTADYSEVKAHMSEYTDARYDLNGTGRVTTADYSVVKGHMGSRTPVKP